MVRVKGGRHVCITRLESDEVEVVKAFQRQLSCNGVPASFSDALRVLVMRGLDSVDPQRAAGT